MALMRRLLDVVHETEELPLGIALPLPAQREAIQPFVGVDALDPKQCRRLLFAMRYEYPLRVPSSDPATGECAHSFLVPASARHTPSGLSGDRLSLAKIGRMTSQVKCGFLHGWVLYRISGIRNTDTTVLPESGTGGSI